MLECTSLIAGHTNQCSERCERALVALVSTEEGADLVNCECDGNKFCIKSKERIEVCRSSVYSATAVDSIVSCNTARWICMADPVCSTALDYYQLFCRDLVHGKGCSHRCNNSLSILNRQEKAAKLRTCYCDGSEEFPCEKLKYNTEKFCYGRQVQTPFGIRLDDPRQRERHHYGHEKEMQTNSIAYNYERYGRRTQKINNNKRHRKFYEDLLESSANKFSAGTLFFTLIFTLLMLLF